MLNKKQKNNFHFLAQLASCLVYQMNPKKTIKNTVQIGITTISVFKIVYTL